LIIAAVPTAKKFAFADALRAEVCAAFHIPISLLTDRETKERPTWELEMRHCESDDFVNYVARVYRARGQGCVYERLRGTEPHSPREVMQWWGAWRREQDADYWIDRLYGALCVEHESHHPDDAWLAIITDCRHSNEAVYARTLDGVIIRVRRAQTDPIAAVDTDVSERGHAFGYATHVINNDGTLADLDRQVHRVLEEIERRAAA
jgi:hypothetical protein